MGKPWSLNRVLGVCGFASTDLGREGRNAEFQRGMGLWRSPRVLAHSKQCTEDMGSFLDTILFSLKARVLVLD